MKALVALAVFALLNSAHGQDDSLLDEAASSSNQGDQSDQEDGLVVAHLNGDNMVEIEDMLLSREQFQELYQPDVEEIGRRVAISGRRWPSGVVPYEFAAGLEVSQSAIRTAMNEWEKQTCVRFIPKRPADTAYVIIRPAQGTCSSAVGRGGGVQYINLGKNCAAKHILMHELGHTLGLLHEHQHPNRNNHVKILWDNIATAHHGNFVLKPSSSVMTYGLPYDPSSIMHYSATAFKNCQNCKTIEPFDPNLLTVMGKMKQLSQKSDIPIMMKMYSCKR